MSNEFKCALVHELCPICTNKMNEHIIFPTELTEDNLAQIKAMDKKAIGFSNEVCENCKVEIDKGYIAFIEVDETKSTDMTLEGVYRLGRIVFLKREFVVNDLLTDASQITDDTEFAFVSSEVIDSVVNSVVQDIAPKYDEVNENV